MDWNQVKFHISKMTPEQLKHTVKLYDPYFGRLVKIDTMDSLSSLLDGIPNDSASPIVLVGSRDRT